MSYDILNSAIGLLGDSLAGSAIFVLDTQHHNSHIRKINYIANNYDEINASLKCYYSISNYKCSFSNYTEMLANEEDLETNNISGRYVSLIVEIERDTNEIFSPRIFEFNVDFSYDELDYNYKSIYKLKSDIFGFEYALLKRRSDVDNYTYKNLMGEVVVKDLSDKLIPLSEFISSSYSKYKFFDSIYPNMFHEMMSGVKDFEVFYDTLVFITESYVIYEKSVFNYSDNLFSIDDTKFRVINLKQLNSVYCDVWFFENTNKVLTFIMQSLGDAGALIPSPKCFNLNLLNGVFNEIEIENIAILNELVDLNIKTFEVPVVTYDAFRNNFNMGMVFYNNQDEFYILSMNLQYEMEKIILKNFDVITPVDYSDV